MSNQEKIDSGEVAGSSPVACSEWPGKMTRKQALKILCTLTDKDDPAWEWATEEFYDEDTDRLPSIWDVFDALDVSFAEVNEALGIPGHNDQILRPNEKPNGKNS